MPSSLFAAATIYGLFSLVGQQNVRIPTSVEWKDVVLDTPDLENLNSDVNHSTSHFIIGNRFSMGSASISLRNVFYELNSIQKLFRALATQWGVSAVRVSGRLYRLHTDRSVQDMEKVVSQWIALCHSS